MPELFPQTPHFQDLKSLQNDPGVRELACFLFTYGVLPRDKMSFWYSILHSHKVIALSINGKRQQFDDRISIAQVLERLELKGKRLALERNGEIVPRSRFKQETLCDGDKLEIVIAVGGG